MRYMSRAFAVVVALLLLDVSVVQAQKAQTRKGFWIGFGFGYGSFGVSCDGCNSNREGSMSGYLKMGGTISPHVLLGGETNGWTKSESGATITAGNASFAAYYYPDTAGGVFLRGGFGISNFHGDDGFGTTINETGGGATIGAGYDLRVGTNSSITPVLNWVWGKPHDSFSQNFFQLAVGVTFH